jgi:hypothetical protein
MDTPVKNGYVKMLIKDGKRRYGGMRPKLYIAIDADGTIWRNKWPGFGKFRFMAKWCIRWMYYRGHENILWTCRQPATGDIKPALEFLASNLLLHYFGAVNNNAQELIDLYNGGNTRKVGADLYLDDKAFFPGWIFVPIVILWLEWKYRNGGNVCNPRKRVITA